MLPFSILDLAPIAAGGSAAIALRNSLELAQHGERLGFKRFWLAEHHNMPGIASAATAVAIAHVAGGTRTIRVGSGGVMLPNHAPLVIAEQFGTLASLFPGRIDLGLGRAPGTDQWTARALRRDMGADPAEQFPQDVLELQQYFEEVQPGQRIRAVPGAGLKVPLWLLGSSLFGAQLAAMLGLPFAFAAHFAPDHMEQALGLYHGGFKPSRQLERAHAAVCVNVFAADTESEARRQFSAMQQSFANLRRGRPGQVPAPVEDITAHLTEAELAMVAHSLRYTFVGTPDLIHARLQAFIERVRPDELMVTGIFHDHAARLRSFELTAQVRDRLNDPGSGGPG